MRCSRVLTSSRSQVQQFALLGCQPATATEGELKRAFVKLAKKHHPDAHPQADAAKQTEQHRRFIEIVDAYEACCAHIGASHVNSVDSDAGYRDEEHTLFKHKAALDKGADPWHVWKILTEDAAVLALDVEITVSLLCACADGAGAGAGQRKGGKLDHLQMLAAISSSGLVSDVELANGCNALLKRFGRKGVLFGGRGGKDAQWQLLVRMIDRMEELAIPPNAATFDILQTVYCKYHKEVNRRVCRWFERQNLARQKQNPQQHQREAGVNSWPCTVQ